MSIEWKNTYIKLWIPVNGQFAGTPKSVYELLCHGDNEGLGIKCFTYGSVTNGIGKC